MYNVQIEREKDGRGKGQKWREIEIGCTEGSKWNGREGGGGKGMEVGVGNDFYNVYVTYMYPQGALASKHIVCTPLSFATQRFILFITKFFIGDHC